MKIDRLINFLLGLFWRPDEKGNRKVWFHSQNLNEDRNGRPKGLPWEGRFWLHGPGCNTLLRFAWKLGSCWHVGVSLKVDQSDDRGLSFHLGLPFFGTYLFIRAPWACKLLHRPFWEKWNQKYDGYKTSHTYTDFTIFDLMFSWLDGVVAFRWNFLKFDWGWSKKMPKWMDGSIYPIDLLFGSTKYSGKELSKHEVVIPMPEGGYPATVKFEECTWRRPRLLWDSHKAIRANVEMKIGIPHQGKGENSWDCDEDALLGMTCKAATIEEAISAVVKSALKSRRRYDGDAMAKYPNPATRIKPTLDNSDLNKLPVEVAVKAGE